MPKDCHRVDNSPWKDRFTYPVTSTLGLGQMSPFPNEARQCDGCAFNEEVV